MLAGVGGKTVADAKRNLSRHEFSQWVEYRKRRGPLNPLLRQESGFALLASLLCSVHGIKSRTGEILSQRDFMPYAVDEPEASFDDLGLMFKKLARKEKK